MSLNRTAFTPAEEDLMRRLRQGRRDDWGLDLPDPAPVVTSPSFRFWAGCVVGMSLFGVALLLCGF